MPLKITAKIALEEQRWQQYDRNRWHIWGRKTKQTFTEKWRSNPWEITLKSWRIQSAAKKIKRKEWKKNRRAIKASQTQLICGIRVGWSRVELRASLKGSGKESACQCKRSRFNPWIKKSPWRRKRQPTLVFWPGKSHGQRSLAGYSPCDSKESDIN